MDGSAAPDGGMASHDAMILAPLEFTTAVPLARPFMTYCVVSEPTADRMRVVGGRVRVRRRGDGQDAETESRGAEKQHRP